MLLDDLFALSLDERGGGERILYWGGREGCRQNARMSFKVLFAAAEEETDSTRLGSRKFEDAHTLSLSLSLSLSILKLSRLYRQSDASLSRRLKENFRLLDDVC